MKNGQHPYGDRIAGSHALVGPREKFADVHQVNLFTDIINWFFARCLQNPNWRGEDICQPVSSGSLTEEQVKSVFEHLTLYVKCAGCFFDYQKLGNGQWVVTAGDGEPVFQ